MAIRFAPYEVQNLLMVDEDQTGKKNGDEDHHGKTKEAQQKQPRGFYSQRQSTQIVFYAVE